MMCDEDTREELDETLKESNDAIMKTVDDLTDRITIHNRLTLVNDTDKVIRVEDLMDYIVVKTIDSRGRGTFPSRFREVCSRTITNISRWANE